MRARLADLKAVAVVDAVAGLGGIRSLAVIREESDLRETSMIVHYVRPGVTDNG